MRRLDIRSRSFAPAMPPVSAMTGAKLSAVSSIGMPAIWAPQSILNSYRTQKIPERLSFRKVRKERKKVVEKRRAAGRSYFDVPYWTKYERVDSEGERERLFEQGPDPGEELGGGGAVEDPVVAGEGDTEEVRGGDLTAADDGLLGDRPDGEDRGLR